MLKKISFWFLSGILLLSYANLSFAQNETNSESLNVDEDLIIANMDFEDGVIEETGNGDIKISFNAINHHTKVLADMVYAIQIIGTKEGGEDKVMYEYVYENDHLTISPKKTIHRTISVPVPGYLDGDFNLKLIGRTIDGITLENYIIGKIKLNKTTDEYVNIQGCLAYVKDEQFLVTQGVDIAKDETINLKCDISNMAQKDLSYFSEVSVYDKSAYNTENTLDISLLDGSIEKNSNKEISVVIPTPKESGYYDASLVFLNKDKKQISNKVNIHFVVQGLSGSISDVVFDKNTYNAGEDANVNFKVSGSADRFPDSRASKLDSAHAQEMSVQIDIVSDNKECSGKVERKISGDNAVSDLKEKIKINKDCHNPVVTLTLNDEKGNVLDKKVLNLSESKDGNGKVATVTEGNNFDIINNKNILKIFLIVTFFLIIIIIAAFFRRHLGNNRNKITIFLFGLASLFIGSSAHAGVLSVCANTGAWTTAYCYYDVTPSSAMLGSTFTTEAEMDWLVCKNQPLDMSVSYNPTTNGAPWTDLVNETYAIDHCENTSTGYDSGAGDGNCKPGSRMLGRRNIFGNICIANSNCNKDFFDIKSGHDLSGSSSFIPTTAGNKTAYFKFHYFHSDGYDADFVRSKGYTVQNSIINCSCGNRSNNYGPIVSNWPASDSWCSSGCTASGTPSTFPDHGGYSAYWSCNSPNGGSNAINCRTGHIAPDPSVDLRINGSNGPITANKDNGDNLDISWNVNKNSSSTSITTTCSKSGSSWGNNQIIPPRPLNNVDNNVLIPNPPYPVINSPYSLTCYNASSDSALNSSNVTDTVNVSVVCNVGDSAGNCSRACGDGTRTITHTNANCTTSTSTESCNLGICPATVEFEEVSP